MTDFTLRPALPADILEIANVVNAHSLATVGTRRALFDADGDLRTARYIPGAAEQIVAVADDGRIGAFAYWIGRPPYVVVEMGCVIHPVDQATELGKELLDNVESRARELLALAPEGARVVLQATVLGDDAYLRELLEAKGFNQAREWVHFELDLVEPPAVDLPEGVTIRVMDPRRDWLAVGAAMDAAFADHWGELGPEVRTLLEEDEEEVDETDDGEEDELEDDPYSNSLGLCFVAEANGEVTGSCLCNARTIEWPDSGKLGSLSVRRAYRRHGVGRALTATALAEFHRRGIRRVITDTDDASFTGANRLYQGLGFRAYRYEQVYEKELRPGVEWRALSVEDLLP
jgi:ribosomal protein S18 acetylase RimI-like enzyme